MARKAVNKKLGEGVCRKCKRQIIWRLSKSGRKYPADDSQRPHVCEGFNPAAY